MNKKITFNIQKNRLDFLTKQYNSLKKSLKEKKIGSKDVGSGLREWTGDG